MRGVHVSYVYSTVEHRYIGALVVVTASLLDLHQPMQSVSIITKVVSSNSAHGEVYAIQHYLVVKFVNDLRQVGSFVRVLRFPPPIKLTTTI